MARTKVALFNSYAQANDRMAADLIRRLVILFASSLRYEYAVWRDTAIFTGKNWHDEIQRAINECDFGLMSVSTEFLISEYIGQHELPQFVGPTSTKPVFPVLLAPLNYGRQNLKGLESVQLFTLARPSGRLTYRDCKNDATRSLFAETLFEHIEVRLDAHFAA
ncbi:MAG: toll/interleukin-1 receptor domain-containing protein [Planctomycetaceae bacterium]|jgi:hypothetical protein|nr:toll/interleukin-1 receptor domain-containing protein [Planctomycetaceae bacterium]MBT6483366.1 toll/interleukin-1 receptor domain-containing protein [Planctomycetaceae bacterium]MBT6493839.1 toll/interleukin-1 receptor domain-containing protein [Planctomycetaceae bacterium]